MPTSAECATIVEVITGGIITRENEIRELRKEKTDLAKARIEELQGEIGEMKVERQKYRAWKIHAAAQEREREKARKEREKRAKPKPATKKSLTKRKRR